MLGNAGTGSPWGSLPTISTSKRPCKSNTVLIRMKARTMSPAGSFLLSGGRKSVANAVKPIAKVAQFVFGNSRMTLMNSTIVLPSTLATPKSLFNWPRQ